VPELPEVEVNRENLARWAAGRTIVDVVPPPGTRETFGLAGREVARRLRGRRVLAVERRGKWMIAALSGGAALALHLGMTGKLARVAPGAEPPRFTRALLVLDDGARVAFVDQRRFGKLYPALRRAELEARRELAEVGPDALALSAAQLRALLAGTARTVKETLMDQRVLAGVGNLYATEALWHARLHPATRARAVAGDAAALRRLHAGLRRALGEGLRHHRRPEPPRAIATRPALRAGAQEEGGPDPFHAYDRAGAPCPRCGQRLASMTLGGRTTVYCPGCQPPPRGRAAR
jgi:formamidopyrimidine-DNA glycosylase